MDSKLFDELMQSVEEMDQIVQGKQKPSRTFEYPSVEVRELRQAVGASQQSFAKAIGVSEKTLQNWEQGRRNPTGPALALLRLVDSDPEKAMGVLCR